MLINDSPVLSYSYYLPPTFIRMRGAHLSEKLEPLPEVYETSKVTWTKIWQKYIKNGICDSDSPVVVLNKPCKNYVTRIFLPFEDGASCAKVHSNK